LASRTGMYRPGRFLPPDPRVEAPYRLTPQTVFRIGILGFLVLTAFAVLFFRLWALQVLSGNQFLQAAENNQLRLLRQEAPRGPIKDRYGRILVDNKGGTAIKIWPANLPKHGQYAEVRRLTEGGADVALECVGATEPIKTAVASVRKGGSVVLVGNISPAIQLPLQQVVTGELTLFGTAASAGEYPRAIELLRTGAIDVRPLITALAPLEEGARMFERLYAREPGLMKVVLQP